MKQGRQYMIELQDQCVKISDEKLLELANNIDAVVGNLLFYSFKNSASYETVERREARQGRVVALSRNVFYIRRRRYLDSIQRYLTDTVASV